ncbi:AAA family ATPase [Methylomonas sp. SURF-1]|uniref:AAA family ATPase n=1 Tax=Methylomonas aurea TaxID=2952224 RepID=A0ABT1UE60_9GAMM|nr:AAA family ATPase [Methylomonas sp. SURF-1]MCQ8180518.1 AAA family ATPase [Methylomonas sp. SURF-1]
MNGSNLASFTGAGLALVPIPPINGRPTKAPRVKGWNMPKSAENPNGYSANLDDFGNTSGFNFGLYHGASNTLALDLDDVERARKVFEELTDFQLFDWLESEQRAEVKSPKPNRAKLLFKLPAGFQAPGVKQCKKPKAGKPKEYDVIFELRCGDGAQDVIVGEHPDYPGQRYQFIGNPAAIPEAPPVLLDMLQHWDAWKPCFDSALGIEPKPPDIAPRQPQPAEQLAGRRDPIQAFNQSFTLADVLTRNGYQQKGRDRFIRPGSASKAPGVAIMRHCADGIERIYSHGGDLLNDGFAHDAFDCFRLLECGGDFAAALNWNPEITQHNQRLHRQEQAGIAPELPQSGGERPGQAEPRQSAAWQPFPLIPAHRLTAEPVAIDWLLENIIERGSLNLLFGEPGAGKSLFALDWAFCMAAGIAWHGCRTKPVDVVVVAGEGHAGMARRLKALESKYQRQAPERLFISQRPANLIDETNAQWIADTIKASCANPGLVIVDTLHRNMDGDENSSQDIGRFIANLDGFFKPLGAAVLVVHHSGHGDKQRSRGSSSIRAAMDGEFSATKDGGAIVLACHKAKDFEAFKPLQFSLKPIDLEWCDDDGEPLTSVYLVHDGEAKPTAKKRKLSARDDAILTSLSEAIAAHGVEPTAEIKAKFGGFDSLRGNQQKIVNIEHWRELAYKAIVVDTNTEDAKRKAFKRCRDKLLNQGFTVEYDAYAWRIFEW